MFPQIKKRIKGFLLEEDGNITKESVLKMGSAVGFAMVAHAHSVFASCGCGCGCGGGCGGGSCGCGCSGCSGGGGACP